MKLLISLCALVGVLAGPSASEGKTYRLKGTVGGDSNGTVSMRVVVKKGEPRVVKAFAWQGLDGFCDDTFAGEQSGSLSRSARVLFRGNFRMATSFADKAISITGVVRNKGRKVRGTIELYFNNGFCNAPPLGRRTFTATRQ